MEMLWAIIGWCLFGLVAGAIARLLVPGRQSMGILMTIVLGIIGSLVGGLIGYMIMGQGDPLQPSGWIMSIVGAVIVLGLYVAMTRRERPVRRIP
jgi:uncharacterized membrane protein YeaQ/YmgE (transglycosylase-associated protein family)